LGGHPHIRREVRDLQANYPDQWALYMLGLLQFQQVDQSDPLSYYRISGIHARPFELWQDAHGPPGEAIGAYCPHGSRLFLTWHRAYLALFEQELWSHVRSIADQAQQDRDRWSAAADAFRIPYWDTALGDGDGGIPDFLMSPRWPVMGPNGTQIVDNPLFWYQFHPLVQEDFPGSPMAIYNQTMRWPTTQDASAKPQVGLFNAWYLQDQRARQNSMHTAFALVTSFNEFSSNVEGSHAFIHIITGGDAREHNSYYGHMYDTGYSAFDPIFMLHHANYDRYMDLYITANPGSWLQPEYVDGIKNFSTFWSPVGTTIDASSGLPPFWKDENTFYTSEDVRRTDIFGYVYPETQYWKFATEEKWRNDVRGTIQRLYPHSARETLMNAMAGGSALTHVLEDGDTFIDWVIEIKASAQEMPASFNAKFFLVGGFSSDESIPVSTWTRLTTQDPETSARKGREAAVAEKRYSTIDHGLSSTLILTSTLLEQVMAGELESLDSDVVVPYLQERLRWKVYAVRRPFKRSQTEY
ncbi:Di-copper centre-containing protein, partial [Bimuria novae-zelandiae CBS 107.79]